MEILAYKESFKFYGNFIFPNINLQNNTKQLHRKFYWNIHIHTQYKKTAAIRPLLNGYNNVIKSTLEHIRQKIIYDYIKSFL